jgi:hypothetical protein
MFYCDKFEMVKSYGQTRCQNLFLLNDEVQRSHRTDQSLATVGYM